MTCYCGGYYCPGDCNPDPDQCPEHKWVIRILADTPDFPSESVSVCEHCGMEQT